MLEDWTQTIFIASDKASQKKGRYWTNKSRVEEICKRIAAIADIPGNLNKEVWLWFTKEPLNDDKANQEPIEEQAENLLTLVVPKLRRLEEIACQCGLPSQRICYGHWRETEQPKRRQRINYKESYPIFSIEWVFSRRLN